MLVINRLGQDTPPCQPTAIPYREGGQNVDRWVLHGAFSRLEPCAVKVARTVLRGRDGGNVISLPDFQILPRHFLLTSLCPTSEAGKAALTLEKTVFFPPARCRYPETKSGDVFSLSPCAISALLLQQKEG